MPSPMNGGWSPDPSENGLRLECYGAQWFVVRLMTVVVGWSCGHVTVLLIDTVMLKSMPIELFEIDVILG